MERRQRGEERNGSPFPAPRRLARLALPVLYLLGGATLAMFAGFLLARSRPVPPPPNRIAVTVLNVGQGEAAFLRTGKGRFIVIGAGPPGQGKNLVAALREAGADRIALLVLPYSRPEALGGVPELADAFPIEKTLEPGGERVNRWQGEAAKKLAGKGVPMTVGRAGQSLRLDGVTLEILAPAEPLRDASDAEGDNSLVLRVVWGETRFLWAGGLGQKGENALLSRLPDLSAQWLRVARSGHRDGTSSEFLRLVGPEIAVVSVGSNRDGLPHPETLARLEAAGATIFRTDDRADPEKPITFLSDGVQITGIGPPTAARP